MVNDIKGIRIRDSVTRNEMALCCYLCALLSKYDISIHALAAERKSSLIGDLPSLEFVILYLIFVIVYLSMLGDIVLTSEGILYPKMMRGKRKLVLWSDFSYRACKIDQFLERDIQDSSVYYYSMYYAKRRCRLHIWFIWINPFTGCQFLLTPSITKFIYKYDIMSNTLLDSIISKETGEHLMVSYEEGYLEYEKYLRNSRIYQWIVPLLSFLIMLCEVHPVVAGLLFLAAAIGLGFVDNVFSDKPMNHCREAYYHEVIRKAGL